jgi:NAD(P)-dependent dehydrogenase (short-subunit alcohol dehydrogenase family)
MKVLEGKVALVTGAGTGIGKGIALAFAAAGAKVVIGARREAPLQAVCELAPGNISHICFDLTRAGDHAKALDYVVATHGRLDILVNNAAYQLWKTFDETSADEIDTLFLTNVTSTTRLIKATLPLLTQTRGNIVNISSTASRFIAVPSQKLSVYSASKAALNQLTRTLAPEIGPLGVRINAVAPGLTRGEYAQNSIDPQDPAIAGWVQQSTPLGRWGEPADIARAVVFLASEQASWITGQVIDSSGGWQIAAG